MREVTPLTNIKPPPRCPSLEVEGGEENVIALMTEWNRQLSTELGSGIRNGDAVIKYQIRGDDMATQKSCGSVVDHK